MRLRDSIRVKYAAITTLSIAAIVAVLMIYFPAMEVEALEINASARLATYGDLVSDQLHSAVGFSDRETAREVMSALHADPDVVSSTLFDGDGRVLIARGHASPWVSRVRHGVMAKRVFSANGRIAVVQQVQSLEGPRGTLVIELSLGRVLARQHTVIWTAIALGAMAMLIGILISTLIARRFARRLRAICDVACAVAAGAPRTERVPIEAWDEIGALASAFNEMVAQLQAEQLRLQESVEERRSAEDRLELANLELAARVDQRKRELRHANNQLRSEMARRTQMQVELRQSQKLESVGRLAAGVAHEINTPVQFVSDSVQFVRDAGSSLLDVVTRQETLIALLRSGGDATQAAAEVDRAVEEADLGFVREELPLALDRTLDGLERVAVIVRSMKVLSHHNAEMSEVDLNRAIDSTLTIARHEYKYVADVETQFGDMGPIVCDAGELNQAILNLVLNAAHAIGDATRNTNERGKITVRTWREAGMACVAIADTGCGIPETIQERIYDPFFTTKDVGHGTGQGLAIARSVIVERHRGTIHFTSEVGRGTEFVIRIPVRPQQLKAAA